MGKARGLRPLQGIAASNPKGILAVMPTQQEQEHQPLLGQVLPHSEYRAAPAHDQSSSPSAGAARRTASAAATPATAEPDMPSLRVLAPVLMAVWVPVFVGALDTTIVATLQSSISSGFHRSEQSSWLGASFFLATCCFTPLYGRLCDPALLGRRWTLILSTGLFALATALCGLAPSMEALIAGRFVAGMGMAGLSVSSSVIMSDWVPIKNRGLLQGALNVLWGLGSGLGGPIGGWMNDHIGWRNAFLIQLPFLLISAVLVILKVHDHHAPGLPTAPETEPSATVPLSQRMGQIDLLGSLTLLCGLGTTITALSILSTQDEEPARKWACRLLILGPLSLVLFFKVEQRAERPILPLKILHSRTPLSHIVANFCVSGGAMSFLYITPLFFQAVRLQSASAAGRRLSPYSLAVAVASLSTGIYIRATGQYYRASIWMNIVMIITPLTFAFVVVCPNVPDWVFYFLVVPQGLGGVSVTTATLIAYVALVRLLFTKVVSRLTLYFCILRLTIKTWNRLINAVDRTDMALATGVSYLFRSAGQAVVVSGSGILLQSLLAKDLRQRLYGPDAAELIARIRHEAALIPYLPSPVREEAVAAYAHALHVVYTALFFLGLIALGANVCMKRKPLPGFEDKRVDRDEESDSAC